MLKKILDRYYLIVMRGYENFHGGKERFYYIIVANFISITWMINIVALLIIFRKHISHLPIFWIIGGIAVAMIVFTFGIEAIYNERRREELREKYKDEDPADRRWAAIKVGLYELASIILLIIALFTLDGPSPW